MRNKAAKYPVWLKQRDQCGGDRQARKQRVGEVVSNKMTKTIVVRVERRFPHPQFKKIVTSYKKFYAHDEKSAAKVGDTVRIQVTPAVQAQALDAREVVETAVAA